jgi:DNA excision repair protein ERCC-2
MFDICNKKKLCAYEMAALLSRDAKVIISDYNYIFNDNIRDGFFLKAKKELAKSIIIVDEAHNLPRRVRELKTAKLSSFVLERAIKEAKKMGYVETMEKLEYVLNVLVGIGSDLDEKKQEKLITKKEFMDKINLEQKYDDLINDFIFVGDEIKERQKRSFVASIGTFLEAWPGEDEGFARIIDKVPGKKGLVTSINYRCLDPSLITKDIIDNSYCTILMSGTLTPTFMYKDILGFKDAVEREFKSPFPKDNRLSLIIPETTTKFTRRGKNEYEKIACVLLKLNKVISGNVLVFFPSYSLRNNVFMFLDGKVEKKVLLEKRDLSKEEKNDLLEEFKEHKKDGAVLLAVTSGNFGEGVDLPGDFVKGVIVVGLPLERPTLEIKQLIDYYDRKFKKGWEYGYVFPAIIKVLQNAGRCIRSETDKGVIIFLDERFAWENYYRCFPMEMDVRISKMYEKRINGFFG